MRKRKAGRLKTKTKKPAKVAKGCICNPQLPEFPLGAHVAICPVRQRYSVNGRMIAELMHAEKKRGNPKDYVVISGYRLLDHAGSYDLKLPDGKTIGIKGVRLVHKSKLREYLGEELAARFWKGGRRRADHGDR